MDPKGIAQQFCQAYYNALQTDKMSLINFYGQNSQMQYNASTCNGLSEIKDQIESFGFQKIQFNFDEMHVQTSAQQGSILVFVNGNLQMDDDPQYRFSQVFLIAPNGQGGFYCHNDIFKLIM